jgi:hypothetical protein
MIARVLLEGPDLHAAAPCPLRQLIRRTTAAALPPMPVRGTIQLLNPFKADYT